MRMTATIEHWLERRGVTVRDVAEIVLALQRPYNDRLTMADCEESVRAVLAKREVQYTLLTGIALDELADRGLLPEPLQQIMEDDESLYGVDETLAFGIVSVYGMIGLTSFGYLDKMKPGVIGRLNGAGGKGDGRSGEGGPDNGKADCRSGDGSLVNAKTDGRSGDGGPDNGEADNPGGTGVAIRADFAGKPDGDNARAPAGPDGDGAGSAGEPRGRVHVFLDDLVSALAAAASARIAHQNPDARKYGLPGTC
jgi:phosphatidylglycerophosphatase A